MELISGLITIVLLVLVPGLAYGQSPRSMLKSCSASARDAVRAGVEGSAGSTVTGCASFYRNDFVFRLDESRVSQWQRHLDESRIEARGRSRLRVGEARAVDRMSRGALRNGAWSLAQLAGAIGAAGLHPSVLETVQPWLRGGYLDGNGHGDPAGNKHGTFVRIPLCPSILLPFTTFLQTYIKPSYSRRKGPRARESLEASPFRSILCECSIEFDRPFIASQSRFRKTLPGNDPDLESPGLPIPKSVEERCIPYRR